MSNRNFNDGTSNRPNRKAKDIRNFDKEAKELLIGLNERQLYDLFQIAHSQSQKQCSEERSKELTAVKKAIRETKDIQPYRLDRIMNGYTSEMAQTGRPKDGQFTPNRKKT